MDERQVKEEISQQDIMNAKQTKTHVTKCPNCGANLTYEPELKALKCDHCDTTIPVDFSKNARELDFSGLVNASNNTWSDEVHVFRCTNCGSKEIVSKSEISKKCAFCGTSNVVETEELCGLKPNAVLPFLISKDAACSRVVAWAKKKVFAPKKFKQSVFPEEIHGNYSPAFTFDSDTVSAYSGRLGEYYYVTVTKVINGKNTQVQERRTRWFDIGGNYNLSFDDVLVQASSSMNQKTVNKLSPFETNASQEYTQEFLQGFSATQYTKDGQACWQEANEQMYACVYSEILAQYTYDVVDYLNIDMHCYNVTYKYILLPIWVGHCNYSKKLYNFFVNGQSGKVAGKTPVSPLKVALLTLGIAAVIAAICLLYYFFG